LIVPLHVLVAGGGTAGHVYPGLALASALRDRGHTVAFVGTEGGLEAKLVPAAGFEFHPVSAKPLVRSVSLAALRQPFAQLGAVRQAGMLVQGADVVVGVGGYVSVPAIVAARRRHIPIVLHEQNAVPGLANRLLSRIANAVALTFPDMRRSMPRRVRTAVTGNPVREEILRVPVERDRLASEGREEFGLVEGRRTVVIFGGSQGAVHVDRAAAGASRQLAGRGDLQVLLITGPAHLDDVRRALPPEREGGLLLRVAGYVDRMDLAYACADLVVSRAGATTIAELTVCGLPALLIPYPYATNGHQEANARALQRVGGAGVLLDDQLSAIVLAERVEGLIDHPERLGAMAERSRSFGRPNAAASLADLVESVGSLP
jgi:UDP-N-acetylglucosamine--N-acetylmuramyl-(pentapeptide) pyrophosphoryl-undecaprenol N-acetylglucosamine transferase